MKKKRTLKTSQLYRTTFTIISMSKYPMPTTINRQLAMHFITASKEAIKIHQEIQAKIKL